MKKLVVRFLAFVFAINSCLVSQISYAQVSPPSVAAADAQGLQQLVMIRQRLAQALKDLEEQGNLSKTTMLSLGAAATGLGMMAAGTASLKLSKAAYDSMVRVGNAGHFGGASVYSGSVVLSSIYQQAKELLNRSIRSDFKKNSQDLLGLMDQALLAPELEFQTKQEILKLRERMAAHVIDLSQAPWYVKTLNFVDYSVSFVGLLFIGASFVSGQPAGIVGAAFLMVPVATVTTLLRALDEAHTIQKQKKVLRQSIAYLDNLIQLAEKKTVLITP